MGALKEPCSGGFEVCKSPGFEMIHVSRIVALGGSMYRILRICKLKKSINTAHFLGFGRPRAVAIILSACLVQSCCGRTIFRICMARILLWSEHGSAIASGACGVHPTRAATADAPSTQTQNAHRPSQLSLSTDSMQSLSIGTPV